VRRRTARNSPSSRSSTWCNCSPKACVIPRSSLFLDCTMAGPALQR